MKTTSLVIGIASAALLLVVLALTRLFVVQTAEVDLDLREVDITMAPELPPPPPPEDPPPELPPPLALSEISAVPDPTRVPVPKAAVPMALDLPVDLFSVDVAPAPLPVVKPRPAPAPRPAARPRPAVKPRPRPTPAPRPKSHYSASELDGRPELIRRGAAPPFPSSLSRRGVTRGTVTLEVELSERGSVRVRRVVSSTHPELVSGAKRFATGSRFTAPKKNGRAVKAIMHWPIKIQK